MWQSLPRRPTPDSWADAGAIAGSRRVVLVVARPTTNEAARRTTIITASKPVRTAWVQDLSALREAVTAVALMASPWVWPASAPDPARLTTAGVVVDSDDAPKEPSRASGDRLRFQVRDT
jgi:hypothetical protein